MTAYGWKAEYLDGRSGTDMIGVFDRLTLGLNIYPPFIRGRAQWQERSIKGGDESPNH